MRDEEPSSVEFVGSTPNAANEASMEEEENVEPTPAPEIMANEGVPVSDDIAAGGMNTTSEANEGESGRGEANGRHGSTRCFASSSRHCLQAARDASKRGGAGGSGIAGRKRTADCGGHRLRGNDREGEDFSCVHCKSKPCHMWLCATEFAIAEATSFGTIQQRRTDLYGAYDDYFGPMPRKDDGRIVMPYCIFMTIERIVRSSIALQTEVYGNLDTIKQQVCVLHDEEEFSTD